ncbi:head-tail connector protein [Antarcticirhabdus aurantiaca]|uniref:Head-tail connector protein n=1 Tax=Antarcticirhabdus aurantiaca TaxID=2606717 RepID=A0ACD4NHJ8_9HYPH|nr:head-tail connector protein [Jeongeuplla avenae]
MTQVSLEDAKLHLNVTTDEDDALILKKIDAAEAWIGLWLEDTFRVHASDWPDDLRQAVLMLTAHFYENREASLVGVSAEAVPFGVQEIIDAHRVWGF